MASFATAWALLCGTAAGARADDAAAAPPATQSGPAVPGFVAADAGEALPDFSPPPDPEDQASFWAIGVHVSWFVPVAREALCPTGAQCIFNGGIGVGGELERRWPSGLALGGGYDMALIDSGSVYELGVLQTLRVAGRYIFSDGSLLHPFVGVAVGGLVFGETFGVDAFGVLLDLTVGVEIELTESFWLSASVPWRMLTTGQFTTEADDVVRGRSGGNTAFAVQLGVIILETP